jgi:hypothetical protein
METLLQAERVVDGSPGQLRGVKFLDSVLSRLSLHFYEPRIFFTGFARVLNLPTLVSK